MNVNNEQTANLRHVFVHLTNKSKRFESRGTHQSTLYTNTDIYCDGKLLGITIDLKPYLAKIRALSDRKKNH